MYFFNKFTSLSIKCSKTAYSKLYLLSNIRNCANISFGDDYYEYSDVPAGNAVLSAYKGTGTSKIKMHELPKM